MRSMALFLLLAVSFAAVAEPQTHDLLVCGWDEVYILNPATGRKSFSWKAAERPELPARYKDKFRTTDECKLVEGGRILITASSDGVALAERRTGRTTFWGICANAHSADLLPGERIAVACSVREAGGNRLALFDARTPEKELFSTELYSGHGAVWDETRKLLWALGYGELRAYALSDWETPRPSLKLVNSYKLPSGGGHELSPGGDSHLVVSGSRDVWLFDRDNREFKPHPQLAEMHGIKSASVEPESGRVAFTQAEPPHWWTSKIQFRNPEGVLTREGERLYKVRWVRRD
ncbi:MAG: hypothetical protein HUU41_23395 [Bryobacteraceae bacterium]|nr:hypothetical protein [Bryobacteraceae bacterium]